MTLPKLPPLDQREYLLGQAEIRSFLGWSQTKLNRYKPEMEECGVLMKEYLGRPPKKWLKCFKPLLLAWLSKKSQKKGFL
jgi:hypothetical protein